MESGSLLSSRLSQLGVELPVWPEPPTGSPSKTHWLEQGEHFAECLKLWRSQLNNAVTANRSRAKELTGLVYAACNRSAWERDAVSYLMKDLNQAPASIRLQAAAQLVCSNQRTNGQLIGAALYLAGHGLIATAIHAVKRVLTTAEVQPHECVEVCSLVIQAISPGKGSELDAHEPGRADWLTEVLVQSKATHLLEIAVSHATGAPRIEELIEALEAIAEIADQGLTTLDEDERHRIQLAMAREQRKFEAQERTPILRTVHHLACTGGTVICKCLAVMPYVALVSEVNPLNRSQQRGKFAPTNPLLLLELTHRTLSLKEVKRSFLQQIEHAYAICQADDVDLVLRDHSHTDFYTDDQIYGVTPIRDFLAGEYNLLSVVTVRHPLDSYLGLCAKGWNSHFSPGNLEEYSRRYLLFLDQYKDLQIMRYEEFCISPQAF